MTDKGRNWCTSVLPPIDAGTLSALLDAMRRWHESQPWTLPPDSDPSMLWEYAERHGLSGVLGSLAWEASGLPPELTSKALQRLYSNQIQFERARALLQEVANAALQLGIGTVVLKGPAISFQAYDDPGIRAFSDIDIFTHSREEALALLDFIGSKRTLDGGGQRTIFSRMRTSENLRAAHPRGFELEIRYPDTPPSEPMFALLGRWNRRLMATPTDLATLLDPDPTLHLVFLIQHMAVHHLFSRFVWFLDVAALWKRQSARINLDEVRKELAELGLCNAGNAVASFVRRHLDPDFPIISEGFHNWNQPLIDCLIKPEAISQGRFGLVHRDRGKYWLSFFFNFIGFQLLTDPGKYPGKHWGYGTHWSLNRFRLAFGFSRPIPWVEAILAYPIAFATQIPARMAALAVSVWRRYAGSQSA